MSIPIDSKSVLIVDDDDVLRERLIATFEAHGFKAEGASSIEEARDLASRESPEYAVVDLRLRGQSGLELVRALIDNDPTTRIVVLTGYGSIATALEAVGAGAVNYLTKPTDFDSILNAFDGLGGVGAPAQGTTPSLARVEWEHINRVLVECDGNISEAARRLGLHRRSLQRKLLKYPPRR